MKRPKKILFGLIFVLATLFSIVLSVCTDYGITTFKIEQTSKTDCAENDLISDTDSFEDDQMNQVLEYRPQVLLNSLISVPQTYFLIYHCPLSMWQPPKNC